MDSPGYGNIQGNEKADQTFILFLLLLLYIIYIYLLYYYYIKNTDVKNQVENYSHLKETNNGKNPTITITQLN